MGCQMQARGDYGKSQQAHSQNCTEVDRGQNAHARPKTLRDAAYPRDAGRIRLGGRGAESSTSNYGRPTADYPEESPSPSLSFFLPFRFGSAFG